MDRFKHLFPWFSKLTGSEVVEIMAVMVCVFVRVMDKDTCQQDRGGLHFDLWVLNGFD